MPPSKNPPERPSGKTPRPPALSATAALVLGGAIACGDGSRDAGMPPAVLDASYDGPRVGETTVTPEQALALAAQKEVRQERVLVSLVLARPENWGGTGRVYNPNRPDEPFFVDTTVEPPINPDKIVAFREKIVLTLELPKLPYGHTVRVFADLAQQDPPATAVYRFEVPTSQQVQTFGSLEPLRSSAGLRFLETADEERQLGFGREDIMLDRVLWVDGALRLATSGVFTNDSPFDRRLRVECFPAGLVVKNGTEEPAGDIDVPAGASFGVVTFAPEDDLTCADRPASIVIGLQQE